MTANNLKSKSIGLYLVLTILTCGLFNLYWNAKQMETCNTLLGGTEFSFFKWLVLTLLTCGVYHAYYQFQMGSVIVNLMEKKKLKPISALPILSAVGTVLFVGLIVDCIHQHELNKVIQAHS